MSETTIEPIRAEIATLESQLQAKKAELRELRASSAKGKVDPKPCGCGCGDQTRGGDFLPGHDARYRGQMLNAIDGGDESAIAALLARPSLLHGATEASLRARLGSTAKKAQGQIERQAEREQAKAEKAARKESSARLAAKSRKEMETANSQRRANKERARAAAAAGTMIAA